MNPDLRSQLKPEGWGARIFEAADRGEIAPEACPMLLADYLTPSLDTTVSAIGSVIWLLGQHPEQWADIRADPQCDPGGDPAGNADPVVFAANRDERKWENPARFDIHRKAIEQLGFGHGVHTCMGMHLAQASTSFLKKRSKKLLLTGGFGHAGAKPRPPGAKVFWFFFSKKNVFLTPP